MSKYRIGDRIRDIDTGWMGTVIGDKYGGDWNLLVAYDENDEIKDDNEYYAREDDIEFLDKKQAFLERLQELLRDFDAEIGIHNGSNIEGTPEGVMLTIYDGCPEIRLFYNMPLVKAKDIFDYDKD